MIDQDIRWQQRFAHFEKAFLLLEQSLSIPNPSIIERAGIIHFFELTLELGLTLLKDVAQSEGGAATTPRGAIEEAVAAGVITEADPWMHALRDRRLTAETYNEEIAIDVHEKIREKYFPLFRQLHQYFSPKVSCSS